MSGDADTLVSILDHEFRFLLGQREAKRQLVLLGLLLDWIDREPRISTLLVDARHEEAETVSAFFDERRAIHVAIGLLWTEHSAWLKGLLSAECNKLILNARGTIEDFEARSSKGVETFALADCDPKDGTRARWLIDWLLGCVKWTMEKDETPSPSVPGLVKALQDLDQRQWHSFRRFQAASHSLPSAAVARLRVWRQRVNLEPAPIHLPPADLDAWWADHVMDLTFSEAIHSPSKQVMRDGVDAVEDAARLVQEDCELVWHALRQRLLIGWSRVALVRRYAARCQAFDAERLRDLADTHQPEAALTRDLARYLFDQGLTPLLEANIGRLRPDLIDQANGTLFYVEAKQYKEKSPRAMLLAAYRQVWSTWGRLREQHHCPEAFLVVFRRSGPRVELPPRIPYTGLVLYSVLVDVAEEAGSSERHEPIRLPVEEILPMWKSNGGTEP